MKYIKIISSFVFFGISLKVLALCLLDVKDSMSSYDWLMTDGVIVTANKDYTPSGGIRRPALYTVNVSYEYSVGNEKYRGDRFYLSSISHAVDKDSANEEIKKLRVGKKIKVFYNPDNHSEAVISREIPRVVYLSFFGGLIFLLISIVLLRKSRDGDN